MTGIIEEAEKSVFLRSRRQSQMPSIIHKQIILMENIIFISSTMQTEQELNISLPPFSAPTRFNGFWLSFPSFSNKIELLKAQLIL